MKKTKMTFLILISMMAMLLFASCGSNQNPTSGANDNMIGTDTNNGASGTNSGTNSGTSTAGNGTATDYNNGMAGGVIGDAARGVDNMARDTTNAVEDFFDDTARPSAGNTTAK